MLVEFFNFNSLPYTAVSEMESNGECYEELESSWSGSGASSNISRSYSNTLPSASRHQRFSFLFVNGLNDPKKADSNEFTNG